MSVERVGIVAGSVQTRSLPTRPVQSSRLEQEQMRAGVPVDAVLTPFPPAGG